MDLNILSSKLGDAHSPPKQEISKQKLPGFIRWPIRTFILPFVWIDVFAQKIARMIIRPPFKRIGNCKKRGNCCYYILFQKQRGIFDRLLKFWCFEINGFFLREKKTRQYDGKHWWVMGCRYLKDDGSCRRYFYRPALCRKWPVIEHFGYPQILKGCGFKAVPRKENLPFKILE